jgi:hypothetical protein
MANGEYIIIIITVKYIIISIFDSCALGRAVVFRSAQKKGNFVRYVDDVVLFPFVLNGKGGKGVSL